MDSMPRSLSMLFFRNYVRISVFNTEYKNSVLSPNATLTALLVAKTEYVL